MEQQKQMEQQQGTHNKPSFAKKYWMCESPTYVTVRNLVYTVSTGARFSGCLVESGSCCAMKTGETRLLLDHISITARPGELLAIVGPSGGGKTTLLNVLAMRFPSNRVPEGEVRFNGQIHSRCSIKTNINYVMAHDKLLPHLSVYETLVSAANLKLPLLSRQMRLKRVETVIAEMCLDKCRDTYIGGEWRKGLSTGELKRVAIGIELLDEPSVLILDEPTGGLDSQLAMKVTELLLKEARKGRTVIMTVHQPSSQIFELFDRFLLISNGKVAYHGPSDRALPYFARLGYTAKKDWNPCDFMLELISDRPDSPAEPGPTAPADVVPGPTETGPGPTATEPGLTATGPAGSPRTEAAAASASVPPAVVATNVQQSNFAYGPGVPNLHVQAGNNSSSLTREQRSELLEKWRRSDEHREILKEIDFIVNNSSSSSSNNNINSSSGDGNNDQKGGGGFRKDSSLIFKGDRLQQQQQQQRRGHWRGEVKALWKRQTLNSIRNPITAIVTLLIQAMQGLIMGGIFFHLSKAGPGPRPASLLPAEFWNNPWVHSFNFGVNLKGNHPLVDAFTSGVDQKGSYVLANGTTPNSEWKNQVQWLFDQVVTSLYNQPDLGMTSKNNFSYPDLEEMKHPAAADWDTWTPRRIYSNLMAAYQLFDRQWPNDSHHPKIDWSFFNVCHAKHIKQDSTAAASLADSTMFYLCILKDGKKTIDSLVLAAGLSPLPDLDMGRRKRQLQETSMDSSYRSGKSNRNSSRSSKSNRNSNRTSNNNRNSSTSGSSWSYNNKPKNDNDDNDRHDSNEQPSQTTIDDTQQQSRKLEGKNIIAGDDADDNRESNNRSNRISIEGLEKVSQEEDINEKKTMADKRKTQENASKSNTGNNDGRSIGPGTAASPGPSAVPAREKHNQGRLSSPFDSKDFHALIGDDLMQVVHAAAMWITRLKSCSGVVCENCKTVIDFFANWITKTIDTISSVLNLSGCLFFVTSVLGFASYDALLTFPQERALFNRETANGLYSPSSHYVAKNLADLPFQMVPCLLMAVFFYFMVGFDVTAKQCMLYLVICCLTTFCAYGFGYMVSAGSPRMEVAILVAPLTLVVWLTLAGYFLRDGDLPVWISWFKYLSFYRWSFFAFASNQFPPHRWFGTLPNTVNLAISGVTVTSVYTSISILLVLGFAYRILGFILLSTTNRQVGLEA